MTGVSLIKALDLPFVDLHLQFDTLELGESDFQREVLDALAGNSVVLNEYQAVFRQWQHVKKECDELKNQKLQFDKEADYNQFQYNELEEAGFKENELEDIDGELKMLSNAEGIKGVLSKVYFELQESESPVVQQIKSCRISNNSLVVCTPCFFNSLYPLESRSFNCSIFSGS